jgi:endonuclease/exonuclease/phosphatase family metal-dependent hydrolase
MLPSAAESCRSAAMPWFGPDDRRDRARLNAWCAGVGQPVVLAAAQANNAGLSRVSLEDIVFVSWNVHVGNGDLTAFVRDLRAGALTDGKPVRHFVLMLQEAVRGADVPEYPAGASSARRIGARTWHAIDIVDISRDLELSLIYVPSMRNGHSSRLEATDRGSAILSTLPLSDPIAVEVPGERQRRVAIFARLSLPSEATSPDSASPDTASPNGTVSPGQSRTLSVGVVHLDALGSPRRVWVFGTSSVRDLQVRAIAPLLPETDLVLGADLNTWHGAREAAPRFLETIFGTRVSIIRKRPGSRVLDYLFFRLGGNLAAQYTIAANNYGSDHYPLIGHIISNPWP